MCGRNLPASVAAASLAAVAAPAYVPNFVLVAPHFSLDNPQGDERARAVAAFLRTKAAEFGAAYVNAVAQGVEPEVIEQVQTGAATAGVLADLLSALATSNADAFQTALERFVNDAVDAGPVRV